MFYIHLHSFLFFYFFHLLQWKGVFYPKSHPYTCAMNPISSVITESTLCDRCQYLRWLVQRPLWPLDMWLSTLNTKNQFTLSYWLQFYQEFFFRNRRITLCQTLNRISLKTQFKLSVVYSSASFHCCQQYVLFPSYIKSTTISTPRYFPLCFKLSLFHPGKMSCQISFKCILASSLKTLLC